jgi:hypothetical protein
MCRSVAPTPSADSLLAARARWSRSSGLGPGLCVALFRAQFGDGHRVDDDGVLDEVLATLQIDPPPVSRRSPIG